MSIDPPDPVTLTQDLIRCQSVTPSDDGALDLVHRTLEQHGFVCTRIERNEISNLFAKWTGSTGPTFAFAGHTDVVPAGDASSWRFDPFSGEISGGYIWGRGATDMKSGVAAFVSAACQYVKVPNAQGNIVLLITGDEEGEALDGTRALIDWMRDHDQKIDVCVVGEPTAIDNIGDVIKIGRRGSMTVDLEAVGVGGHTAYPQHAKNPLPTLVRLLDRLASTELDFGTAHFEPSTLAITTVDVGNCANNVIPEKATARVNIRFNEAHKSETLHSWIRDQSMRASKESGIEVNMNVAVSGEAFKTGPGPLTDVVIAALENTTGNKPKMTTGGGTSDARFIKDLCPVVEVGLVGRTMHKVDECAAVKDIYMLSTVYLEIIKRYFENALRG